ncbi:hypothetical protein [Hydrocarboniphaga sp.]|jgi:hypothetical protein|uniref:hypothetical protein n=1 Tax=Hydrocarboniphaga sp. TaxID=2033016 RepID=UPI002ABAA1E6|nr:hypothetical protein [Hydrocarboniphaga sp.]MDZ4078472.1 hypothetical protein [Hydrocarboniphaga sp.]
MSRLTATWMFCLGLVLTRVLGVHIHVCSGLEQQPTAHEQPHYADAGLLFGESHDSDHADDRELELAVMAGNSVSDVDLESVALPCPDRATLSTATGWLSVLLPQGPPTSALPRPSNFTPPSRGPPSISLT